MTDEELDPIRETDKRGARRRASESGPGWMTVVLVSSVTSVLATIATVIALVRTQPGMLHADRSTAIADAGERSSDARSAPVVVPDLVRVPEANVRSIVEALGLRLIVNERREQSEAPEGSVAAQAPRAGTSVARGSDVVVVLSSGPALPARVEVVDAGALVVTEPAGRDAGAQESVVVPSVYRLHVSEARSRLTLVGLSLGSQRRGGYDEDLAPGRILRQSPSAGARVARGTVVDVWINEE
jgi:hypothetical protein